MPQLSTCVAGKTAELSTTLVCEQFPDATADGVACPQTCMAASPVDTCDGTDDDCDGASDDDYPNNTNPLCSVPEDMGQISGDTGAEGAIRAEMDERWYRVTVAEDSAASDYLSATVALDSPPGADFDLYVYCFSCGGSLAGSSQQPSGTIDVVEVRRNDSFADETFDVWIEVRYFSGQSCSEWQLAVQGNTVATTETCP